MNFFRIFSFLFACVMALTTVSVSASPRPDWDPLKDLERAGQNIRDAIIKAKPAVDVLGEAVSIYKSLKEDSNED